MGLSNLKKFIGQGEIYVGVTAPAANTALALTAGVPATGTDVGLTSGEATLTYKPTFTGVSIEQTTGEVAPRVTNETVELKFMAAEAVVANIGLALQTGTSHTTTGPGRTFYTVGGKVFFSNQCVVLVSPFVDDGTGNTWYEWVCLYSAMSVQGLVLKYKRNDTRMIEVTFTGYPDPTRPVGDQTFQIGQQTTDT